MESPKNTALTAIDFGLLAELGRVSCTEPTFEAVCQVFYAKLPQLMPFDFFGVDLYHPEERLLEYIYNIENGARLPNLRIPITQTFNYGAWCVTHGKSVFVNDSENEYLKYLTQKVFIIGDRMESILYVPLFFEDRVLGTCSVQTKAKHSFTEQHLHLLEMLAPYLAAALIRDQLHQSSSTLSTANQELGERMAATEQRLRETQAQLVQSEKMAGLGHMLSGLAHELSTPLAAIASFTRVNEQLAETLSERLASHLRNLTEAEYEVFGMLVRKAASADPQARTRYERSLRKSLETTLVKYGLEDVELMADRLAGMQIFEIEEEWLPLFRQKDWARSLALADAFAQLVLNNKRTSLAAERTTRILQALRVYARPEDSATVEPIDGNLVLEDSLLLLKPLLSADIKVERRGSWTRKPIGSRSAVTQALSAVLHNSVQALPPTGGTIILELEAQAEAAVIRVIDNGLGIPLELQPRLFEPFFTTRPGEGLGLGLYNARRTLGLRGATIELRSTAGRTVCEIRLPWQ